MGTSLSGLTPATTFDGLLKTSDNDAIGTGLKTIGTGDGTDSVLQLSDSELNVAGQFNVDTGNALNTINLRGDSLVINQIYQANEVTYNSIAMVNSSGIRLNNGSSTTLVARSGNVGIGGITNVPTARLQVKGSGATSATTSLLVQNSAGTDMLKVQDDGLVQVGTSINLKSNKIWGDGNTNKSITLGGSNTYSAYSNHIFNTYDGTGYNEAMRITGFDNTSQFVGIGETTPTARLHVKGSGNDNTTTSLLVQNSDGDELLSLDDIGGVRLGGDGNTTTKANIKLDAYSGLFNVTAAKFGNWDGAVYAVFSGLSKNDALFAFGNDTTTASTRMHIKGLGASAGTTALLVQNSDGTELFKVDDSGATDITANITNAVLGSFRNTDANGFGIELRAGNATSRYSMQWERYSGGGGGRLYPDGVMIGDQVAPTARLQVKGSGNDATTTALLVQNSAGTDVLKVTDDGILDLGDAGARGEITLGRSSDGAQMGSIFANTNGLAIRGNSNVNTIMVGLNTNQGITINNGTAYLGASLGVKGFGATSATTALLVQNSTGTEHFKTTDDGVTTITSASQSVPLYVNASGSATAGIEIRSTSARRFRILATSTITTLEATNTGGISTNASLSVGSGYTPANASAVLQADSTTQGFLPPRMTDAERDAITNPAAGLMIYDTSNNQMNYWNGSTWIAF